MKHLHLVHLLAPLGLVALLARTPAAAPATHVLVETDPATFAFGGFAVHVRAEPAAAPRWSVGVGAYATDLPSPIVELDPANRGEGWEVRVRLGVGAFVDRAFRDDGEGLGLGLQLAVQRWTARGGGADTDYTSLLAMPRLTYRWSPGSGGFYVMPWLGLGLAARVIGDGAAPDGYTSRPVVPYAALHAGWRF